MQPGENTGLAGETPAQQVHQQAAFQRGFMKTEINHEDQDQVRLVISLQQGRHQHGLQNDTDAG